MAETIKVYDKESVEYKKLEAAAVVITAFTGVKTVVKDVYFDLGQDWKWSTLVTEPKDGWSCQILCPRDHALIIQAEDVEQFNRTIETILKEKKGW